MLYQPDKATLAAFGVPSSAFDELNLGALYDSLSNDEIKRVKSGILERFYIFPRAKGQYIIISVKEGKEEKTYQANFNSFDACSCSDFMFNCAKQGISCKHIWRIRLLVKLGCLPGRKEDPFSWFISELYKDMEWLSNLEKDTSENINELKELEQEVTIQGRQNINYKQAFRKRAQIMTKSAVKSF